MINNEGMDWKEGCEPSGMNCPVCGKEMLVGEVITIARCLECENAEWRRIVEGME